MNSFLFVNPLSGSYDPRRVAALTDRLERGGIRPELCRVSTPAEIAARCRAILDAVPEPLLMVAGGDGTVNAVVNSLPPGRATLAVLPLGTSNVLAAELGICSPEDGVERLLAGRSRSLPVGLLELERATLRFLLMAGIGVDGAVVGNVNPRAKRHLRQGAYLLSALGVALKWDRSPLELRLAGRELACHGVIVCAASRYGGDFVLAPESDLFAPEFTVICLQGSRRRDYLRLALRLFTGRLAADRSPVRMRAREVEVRGKKPIQLDGDFVGHTPARLRVLEDFARIVV